MPEYLTREELAEHWGVSPRTIDKELAAGRLPHLRIGKKMLRFEREYMDQWALQQHAASVKQEDDQPPPDRPRRRPRRIVQAVPAEPARRSPARPVRPDGGEAA